MNVRELLIKRIEQLRTQVRYYDPQVADICALAPHLTHAQAAELLETCRADAERTYFVGPGLSVRGALQVYCLDWERRVAPGPAKAGLVAQRRLMLYRAHTARVKASYACREAGVPAGSCFYGYPWQTEALDWAEVNYGEELAWDTSREVLLGFLVSPGTKENSAFVSGQFTAWLDRPVAEIRKDTSEPLCELMDDAILRLSYYSIVQDELVGNHLPVRAVYCGLCGGAVGDTHCLFCDTPYPPNAIPGRTAWDIALPTKAELGEAAVKFTYPPLEARKWEHRKWATSSFCPPTRAGAYGREQRIVQLGD